MNKTIALFFLFVALGLAAFYTLNNNRKNPDSFASNIHTYFAIDAIDDIERVFMVDRSGNQALVEKIDAERWSYTNKVSGKKYAANKSAIFGLLETIRKVRVREPVGQPALKNAVKSLSHYSTKVEVYGKNKKKLKVYYVGAMTSGGTGNYMIMEGSEKPYISYIPNFQGTIGTRFITTEEDWRDKAIFRTNKDALEFVQVEYQNPKQYQESFKVSKLASNQYQVDALDPQRTAIDQRLVNQDNADTYFDDFDVVAAEKILYDKTLRDSIITTTPFAIVSYKADYHQEAQVFRIYSLYNPNADRGDGQAGHRQKIQRYFVDIDEDNFFLGQHLVLRKILWGYRFFFQEEAVQLIEDEAVTKRTFPDNKEQEREERAKRKEKQARNE
jgi:hypothetical protein